MRGHKLYRDVALPILQKRPYRLVWRLLPIAHHWRKNGLLVGWSSKEYLKQSLPPVFSEPLGRLEWTCAQQAESSCCFGPRACELAPPSGPAPQRRAL